MNKWVDRITFWACCVALVAYIVTLISIIFIANAKERNSIKYDCRIAEISVDYPQQVKEQCRKLLMPQISYGEK
jgi:hypothetical protein